MADDDIHILHKRTKPRRDEDLVLHVVRDYSCRHPHFIVDEAKSKVECGLCGEKLNPMWVLQEIARQDSQLAQMRDALSKKVTDLRNKTKYKCGSCGKMNDLRQILRYRTED